MKTMTISRYQSKSLRCAPEMLEDIKRGRFGFDQPLPKEDDLAQIYGVSRATLRRMIMILEQHGTLTRRPHRGVWINNSDCADVVRPQAQGDAAGAGQEGFSVCAMIQSDIDVEARRPAGEFVTSYLAGMSAEANRCNISLLINYVPLKQRDRADSLEMLPPLLRNSSRCGIVLVHYYPVEVVRRLAEKHFCSSIYYDYPVPGVDTVNASMNSAVKLLMQRLFDHGHRKIAFAGIIKKHWWTVSRFSGYVDASMQLGLEYDAENVVDFSDGLFEDNISTLCRRIRNGVTALVCEYDDLGYLIMQRLKELGISVPRDLAMTGFDAVPVPPGLCRLTSVCHPAEFMGAAAIKALVERAQNPDLPARQINFACEIVDGESIMSNNRISS